MSSQQQPGQLANDGKLSVCDRGNIGSQVLHAAVMAEGRQKSAATLEVSSPTMYCSPIPAQTCLRKRYQCNSIEISPLNINF